MSLNLHQASIFSIDETVQRDNSMSCMAPSSPMQWLLDRDVDAVANDLSGVAVIAHQANADPVLAGLGKTPAGLGGSRAPGPDPKPRCLSASWGHQKMPISGARMTRWRSRGHRSATKTPARHRKCSIARKIVANREPLLAEAVRSAASPVVQARGGVPSPWGW